MLKQGNSNDRQKTRKFSKLDNWNFLKKKTHTHTEVESQFDSEQKKDKLN